MVLVSASAVTRFVVDNVELSRWNELFQQHSSYYKSDTGLKVRRRETPRITYKTELSCEQLTVEFAKMIFEKTAEELNNSKAIKEVGVRLFGIYDNEGRNDQAFAEFIWKATERKTTGRSKASGR